MNGIASHPPEPARTACTGAGGATLCNGSSATPACVVCLIGTDCPGTDSICHTARVREPEHLRVLERRGRDDRRARRHRQLQEGGVRQHRRRHLRPRRHRPARSTTATAAPTTSARAEAPSHPTKADGTTCTAPNGGRICSGAVCVQCITVANCPGSDTICRTAHLPRRPHLQRKQRARRERPPNPMPPSTARRTLCDGNGGNTSVADDTDKPVDGDACTSDVCTNGVPSNPDLPRGTPLRGRRIEGVRRTERVQRAHVPRRARRHRHGRADRSASTAVFVEERRTDGSLVGTALALPTAAAGANRPLTMSAYVDVGGRTCRCPRRALPDARRLRGGAGHRQSSSAATAATVNRVVGRVDVGGNVNTTTSYTTACSGNNARSAASTDGSEFWLAGARQRGTGGVWYNHARRDRRRDARVGVDAPTTCASRRDLRQPAVRLLERRDVRRTCSRSASARRRRRTRPRTSLPGLPTSGASPYAYALFDLRGRRPRGSTRCTSRTGDGTAACGVQKWTFNGTTWTRVAILNIAGGTLRLPWRRRLRRRPDGHVDGDHGRDRPTAWSCSSTPAPARRSGRRSRPRRRTPLFRGVAVSPHFAAP